MILVGEMIANSQCEYCDVRCRDEGSCDVMQRCVCVCACVCVCQATPQHGTHGSLPIRRQRGHPGAALLLVIYNSANDFGRNAMMIEPS